MTCPACTSIWLRPADLAWLTEGDAAWTRRFECGNCGAILVVRVTRIGIGNTDRQKHEAAHGQGTIQPAPRAMLEENGGGK